MNSISKNNVAKILILSPNSDEAGVPRHIEQIVMQMSGEYEFIFVTGETGPVYYRLKQSGIKCIKLKHFSNDFSLRGTIATVRDLHRILSEVQADILHLHSAKSGICGRLIGKIHKKNVVYTVHGWGWRGMPPHKALLIWSAEFLMSKLKPAQIICVAKLVQQQARKFLFIGRKRSKVIYNGISDIKFRQKHTSDGVFNIVFPARVCSAKNHSCVAKAITLMNPRVSISFCGAGTDKKEFKEYMCSIAGAASSRLTFHGEVSNIEEFYSKSDCCILSSHFEALPISIIEAMRASLPVIASNVGGIPEIIDSGFGFLFENNDHQALARIVNNLVENPQYIRQYGHVARRTYLERFSDARMIKELGVVYKQCLVK